MKGKTDNLHPDLVGVIRELERRMGFELTINSGHRTRAHNIAVGGVDRSTNTMDSEHTLDPSEGADILCLRSVTRYKMIGALYEMGITRIGIGKTFVHVGISKLHPQNVMWTYYPTEPQSAPAASKET